MRPHFIASTLVLRFYLCNIRGIRVQKYLCGIRVRKNCALLPLILLRSSSTLPMFTFRYFPASPSLLLRSQSEVLSKTKRSSIEDLSKIYRRPIEDLSKTYRRSIEIEDIFLVFLTVSICYKELE